MHCSVGEEQQQKPTSNFADSNFGMVNKVTFQILFYIQI